MEILKRTLSAFLALVMVCGMLPMPAAATEAELTQITEETTSETTVPETTEESVPETTAAEALILETEAETAPETTGAAAESPETEPGETEPVQTEAAETEPVETEPAETVPAETEAPETEPVETEPAQTEPELAAAETAADWVPSFRPIHYQYVTEETWTKTEDVTKVEAMDDGTFWSYDTQETTSGTYKKLHEVYLGGPVMTLSLEETSPGDYSFETFEDLKELAAMSFPEWTYGLYTGTGDLVIEEDLTLPENLHLQTYESDVKLVVPSGVHLIAESMYVERLVVEGRMTLRGYITVEKELTVTGSLYLDNTSMGLEAGAELTGIQNITRFSEWNHIDWNYYVYSQEELLDAVAAANADNSICRYNIDLHTDGNSEFLIDQSITIPENVILYGYNDEPITIAAGCTLTLNCDYGGICGNLQVDGTLENNSDSIWVEAPITFSETGSYRGVGELKIAKFEFDTWEDAVPGLDLDNVHVTDDPWNDAWILVDVTGLIQLGKPYDLTWHKTQEYNMATDSMKLVTQYGAVAWRPSSPDLGGAEIAFYNAEDDSRWNFSSWRFEGPYYKEWRAVDDFVRSDPESGTYYFTVVADIPWDAEGDGYYASDAARSETWTYTKPAAQLAACAKPTMTSKGACSWQSVANAAEYEVDIYYAATEYSEPYSVSSSWGIMSNSLQLREYTLENMGAGYYSFRVRALSKDITKTCNGAWSELSNAVYLKPGDIKDPVYPDTPAFDSTAYLNDLVKNHIALQEEVVLTKNYTLTGELNLFEGAHLIVPEGITLTISNSLILQKNAKLEVAGKLVNNKYLSQMGNSDSLVEVYGTYTHGANATIYCAANANGTIAPIEGIDKDKITLRFDRADENTLDYVLNPDFSGYKGVEIYSIGMDIRNDVVIPAWVSVHISPAYVSSGLESRQLTIHEGVTLALEGRLVSDGWGEDINGSIVNNGTILVYAPGGVYNYGAYEGNAPINCGGTTYPANLGLSGGDYLISLMKENQPLNLEIVLSKNTTLPEGLLEIGPEGAIIIPKGVTLTVNGEMIIIGGVGVMSGGKLVNNNCLHVCLGGLLMVDGTYTHGRNAVLNREAQDDGEMAEIVGIDESKQQLLLLWADEETLEYAKTVTGYGSICVSAEEMTLTKNTTIPRNMVLIVTPIDGDMSSGSNTLTVSENVTLTIEGGLLVERDGILDNLGTIIVKSKQSGWMQVYGSYSGEAPIVSTSKYVQNLIESGQPLTKPVTLDENLTVDGFLYIDTDGHLTVPKGVTLTLNGEVYVYGKLEVQPGGKIVNNRWLGVRGQGLIQMNGTYTHGKEAILQREGTLSEIVGIDKAKQELLLLWADEETLEYAKTVTGYGNICVSTEEMTLTKNTTIPRNMVLFVTPIDGDMSSGSNTLTVSENVTLTIEGGLVVERDGILDNLGTIIVKSKQGGWMQVYGSYSGEEPIVSTSKYVQNLIENGQPLTKPVTLDENLTVEGFLRIDTDGHLTVPRGITLTIVDNGGLCVAEGGRLDAQAGATIKNNGLLCTFQLNESGYIHVNGSYTHGKMAFMDREILNGRLDDVVGIADKYQTLYIPCLSEDDLRSALESIGTRKFADVVINAEAMNLTESLVIPDGTTLYVVEGVFEICDGTTLTLNGDMIVENNGKIQNNGALVLNKGAMLNLDSGEYYGNDPVFNGGRAYPCAADVVFERPENTWMMGNPKALDFKVLAAGSRFPGLTWKASNPKILDASMIEWNADANYTIPAEAFLMPGTVKLTATTVDGSNKSAVMTINVLPTATEVLELKMMQNDELVSVTEMKFDKNRLTSSFGFNLVPEAETSWGIPIPMNSKSIKWSCDNTKLVTVRPYTGADANGAAAIVVNYGQDGVANVIATTTDAGKVEARFTITVVDPTPRLEGNKITLDPNSDDIAAMTLMPSYGNEIYDVWIENDWFAAVHYDNTLYIRGIPNDDGKVAPNGTVKTKLHVKYIDGEDYTFDLTITVKNTKPTVTVKQEGKLNFFLAESEAELLVTAKNADVGEMYLEDTDDFYLDRTVIRMTGECIDNLMEDPKYKPDTKATLVVYVDGYQEPERKAVTISAATTKPSLTTDPASSTINTKLMSAPYSIALSVYDKTAKEALYLDDDDIENVVGCTDVEVENGQIILTFPEGYKGGTVDLYIRKQAMYEARSGEMETWTQPIKVSHKIKVDTKDPTVTLGATTLKLNSYFTNQEASTNVILSAGNLSIQTFPAFETTAKEGTAAYDEAQKISVYYDSLTGRVHARIIASEPVKAGTYTYTATPTVAGKQLKAVTVKVAVAATAPKITLKSTTVKLNTELTGYEAAKIPVTMKDTTGYEVVLDGFVRKDNFSNIYTEYVEEDDGSYLYVVLMEGTAGKFGLELIPEATDNRYSDARLAPVKLTVQTYANKTITVTQSAKGKLDAVDPNSELVYTISKITNAMGPVEEVRFVEGYDERIFLDEEYESRGIEMGEDAKGNQTFTLRLNHKEVYSTKQNYEVKFQYQICGQWVEATAVTKLKISQSALKVAAPKTVTYYMAQEDAPLKLNGVGITAPAGAAIGQIFVNEAKSSKELLAATDDRYFDEDTGMEVDIANPSALTVGKTYKLVLDITPVGNTQEGKPTQVTISVKIAK